MQGAQVLLTEHLSTRQVLETGDYKGLRHVFRPLHVKHCLIKGADLAYLDEVEEQNPYRRISFSSRCH
jgi:hypothetical protein